MICPTCDTDLLPPPAPPDADTAGTDCATPLFVHVCSTDVQQIDVEYVCDETTDTWHRITFIDGVETSTVDTGRPCSDPPPADLETIRECRNDTIWAVFYTLNPDGTITETNAINTGEPCTQPTIQIGTPTCMNVDGTKTVIQPIHTIHPDGTVTTAWIDPITGQPVTGTITHPTPTTI